MEMISPDYSHDLHLKTSQIGLAPGRPGAQEVPAPLPARPSGSRGLAVLGSLGSLAVAIFLWGKRWEHLGTSRQIYDNLWENLGNLDKIGGKSMGI